MLMMFCKMLHVVLVCFVLLKRVFSAILGLGNVKHSSPTGKKNFVVIQLEPEVSRLHFPSKTIASHSNRKRRLTKTIWAVISHDSLNLGNKWVNKTRYFAWNIIWFKYVSTCFIPPEFIRIYCNMTSKKVVSWHHESTCLLQFKRES